MTMIQRFNNREAIVAWKAESASHPEFGDTSYGTAPTSPNYGICIDAPQINERGGIVRGYGVGHQKSSHIRRDRHEVDISLQMRVTDQVSPAALIDACIQSSAGALTRIALWTGISNRGSAAVQQLIHRHCKCARWALSIREGQEVMFSPTLFALGKPDKITSSLLSPGYSDIVGDGTDPESFATFSSMEFNAGGTAFNARPYIKAIQLQYDSGLSRENMEKDLGDDVATSLRALQLVEGPVAVQGSVTLDALIEPSVIAAVTTAADWQELGDVVITLAGSTYTIKDFCWNGLDRQGGASGNLYGYQLNFVASDIVRADT